MKRFLKNRKAQQTAEYAILIAFVIAAAMAIQTYVKRGLQAKVKDAVLKYTSDTRELGGTSQYEPYYLQSDFSTTTKLSKTESEEKEGSWQRTVAEDSSDRKGTQEYKAPQPNG